MQELQVKYDAIKDVRFCPSAPERNSTLFTKTRSQSWGLANRAWLVDNGGTNYYQGSYCLNGYLYNESPYGDKTMMFAAESDVQDPVKTPFFADAIWVDAWPLETDRPAVNLMTGDQYSGGGLSRIAIPRHVASAGAAVSNFNPKNLLPGAVNVGFADNHAESVRLENLWTLTWHKNWAIPAKRPGL
jgi:prepilin-type processing-associated H-X9-DG protein